MKLTDVNKLQQKLHRRPATRSKCLSITLERGDWNWVRVVIDRYAQDRILADPLVEYITEQLDDCYGRY